MSTTGIGIVGTGFVADYYAETLRAYDELRVVGTFDRNDERNRRFGAHHGTHVYPDLDALLGDPAVSLVVNLTNPREHAAVSRAAIDAGHHVYSEKPLAMDLAEAAELVARARARGVLLSSAPCSLLGEAAQTLWRAIRRGDAGAVRVVYAEMDEGMVHRMPFRRWVSASGAPWPYRDEFEVGTVVEHAGYVTTWLPAMFGAVRTVEGAARCLEPDKAGVLTDGTDFSVAVLSFASGVVARVTCSLFAPHDHSLTVVGDRGVLRVDDTWYYGTKVTVERSLNVSRRHVRLRPRVVPPVRRSADYAYRGTQQMDFARGIADLAQAARDGRDPRLSADYCLHTTELTLALTHALRTSARYELTTPCPDVEPMPWAQ